MTEDHTLRREAVAAGLRRSAPVNSASVRRRRRQLALLLGLICAGGATAVAMLTAELSGRVADGTPARMLAGTFALVVGFCLYCVEKEVHLRRIERLLVAERAFSAEVAARLDDLGALLRAGRAVNSAMELAEVLDTILDTTLEMFSGASGSVLLRDGADELVVVSARGNDAASGARAHVGEGIAGRVGASREAVLLNGVVDVADFPGHRARRQQIASAMSVPLLHRDALVGVLNVTASDGRTFEPGDLELLSLFAEHAASGVAHARMHAEERHRIDEMVRLEQMKSEFITGVSHDLRTPLTSIVGCTAVAKRADVDPEQRAEMLAIVEGQAQRLSAMVERMLLSAELGIEARPASLAPFDLMAAADEVAEAHGRAGHPVRLDGPLAASVIGDRARLQQALDLLVENAFRHGAPPVVVAVSVTRTRVTLAVSDRGPGIAPADRDRVFERFVRLDASRGTPGVGLGLSIVRGLVSTMGGTVRATEPRGGGVAFVIELVAAVPEQQSGATLRLVAGG